MSYRFGFPRHSTEASYMVRSPGGRSRGKRNSRTSQDDWKARPLRAQPASITALNIVAIVYIGHHLPAEPSRPASPTPSARKRRMHSDPTSPIGIFDSGVGGLTVARAVMERLPCENIVYFGDTARVPYGVKSPETVARYASEITRFLLARQVKLLIIACNTMAAVALQPVLDISPVPVLEVIDAGARNAVASTRNRRIGIIGTPSTINSQAYLKAIRRHDSGEMFITSRACPLFVPLVEEGWLEHPVTRLTAQEYLAPLLTQDIDTLVLGCTHYPLLKPLLQSVVGPDVALLDSAEAIALRTAAILREKRLGNPQRCAPRHVFHVTDVPHRFQEIGARFLGQVLADVRREEL